MTQCPLSALANIATLLETAPINNGSGSPSSIDDMKAIINAGKIEEHSTPKNTTKNKRSYANIYDAPSAAVAAAVTKKIRRTPPKLPTQSSLLPTKTTTKKSSPKKSKDRMRHWLTNPTIHKPSFPTILMGILSAPQNDEHMTFLSSDDVNDKFIIIDGDVLERVVLPLHFDDMSPTFDEFTQLLSLWGFKTSYDPEYPSIQRYSHPLFRKGDWESCLQITLPQSTASKYHRHTKKKKSNDIKKVKTIPKTIHHPNIKSHKLSPLSRMKARSVTPPDCTGKLLPYQAIASTLPEESAAEWLVKSATLERRVAATSESRRRLTVTAEEQGGGGGGATADTRSLSPSALATTSSSSSMDAEEVQKKTSDVVSAAMAALQHARNSDSSSNPASSNAESLQPLSSSSSSSSSSSLNAMTMAFIQRSNSRRMQSRPAGIYGARGQSSHSTMAQLSSQLSNHVDTQTRAMLAKHLSRKREAGIGNLK